MKLLPFRDRSLFWTTNYPGSWINVFELRQVALRLTKGNVLQLELEIDGREPFILDRLAYEPHRTAEAVLECYLWERYQAGTYQSRANVEEIFSSLGIDPGKIDLVHPAKPAGSEKPPAVGTVVARAGLYVGALNYPDKTCEVIIFTRPENGKVRIVDGLSVVENPFGAKPERRLRWFAKNQPPNLGMWWWADCRVADHELATPENMKKVKEGLNLLGFDPDLTVLLKEEREG